MLIFQPASLIKTKIISSIEPCFLSYSFIPLVFSVVAIFRTIMICDSSEPKARRVLVVEKVVHEDPSKPSIEGGLKLNEKGCWRMNGKNQDQPEFLMISRVLSYVVKSCLFHVNFEKPVLSP